MVHRKDCYKANKDKVGRLKANGNSKATFEVNETADLTDAEYSLMMGA